jgi:hypothetical protein
MQNNSTTLIEQPPAGRSHLRTVPVAVLLTRPEAAAMLHVSLNALDRLGMPKVRLGRRCTRYRLSDVEKLIVKRTIEGRAFCS